MGSCSSTPTSWWVACLWQGVLHCAKSRAKDATRASSLRRHPQPTFTALTEGRHIYLIIMHIEKGDLHEAVSPASPLKVTQGACVCRSSTRLLVQQRRNLLPGRPQNALCPQKSLMPRPSLADIARVVRSVARALHYACAVHRVMHVSESPQKAPP